MLADQLRADDTTLLAFIDALEAHYKRREPTLQAFVPETDRFQRLRRQAKALLAQYPDPAMRPPLFGLLVGVKDIYHVDGFPTHAGSQLPPAVIGGMESDAVTRLRAAGALIMGKTVTTEFAYFGSGPTTNPHNPAHTPGGSSSGSAAAVGAGLCAYALGTQTIGSVNRPAAFCGVVGFKPSYNRVPKTGVIPVSTTLDHVGAFANSVAEMALLAATLVPNWMPLTAPATARLAIPDGPYLQKAEPEALAHFEKTVADLEAAGFTIVRLPLFDDFDDIATRHNALMAAECADTHKNWYAEYKTLYHPKTAGLIEKGMAVSDEMVAQAKRARLELRKQFIETLHHHDLDAFITPSAPGPAPRGLASTGDPVMNLPWTQSGLPTLTLPSGKAANKLPLAIQLIGHWRGDERLLALGTTIEKNINP